MFHPHEFCQISGRWAFVETLSLEILFEQNRFIRILNDFHIKCAQLTRYQRWNFYNLIANICVNKLHMKYILAQKQIWKPLFLGIISNIIHSLCVEGEFFMKLVTIMHEWRPRHFKFIIKKGLDKAVIRLIERWWSHCKDDLIESYGKIRCKDDEKYFLRHIIVSTDINPTITCQNIQRFYALLRYQTSKANMNGMFNRFSTSVRKTLLQFADASKGKSRKARCKRLYFLRLCELGSYRNMQKFAVISKLRPAAVISVDIRHKYFSHSIFIVPPSHFKPQTHPNLENNKFKQQETRLTA